MKLRLSLMLAIIIAVVLGLGGCTFLNLQSDSETDKNTITFDKSAEVTESGTEITTQTTITDTSKTTKTTETDIKTIDISMTDDEIYELGIKRADELQNLFIKYLNFNEEELAFANPFNGIINGKYIHENGSEDNAPFCIIDDNIFKTYNDLYMLFNKTCTPEYSTQLLKFTSVQYTDIDGKLCFHETLLCQGPQEYENLKYVSINMVNDEIKLNVTAISFFINDADGIQERMDFPLREYSIYLKNIDGEWLVSDCTDIYVHGYYWNK